MFSPGMANRVNAVLAATYDSRVTVSRLVDRKAGNVTTQTRPAVYTDIPCRRSKTSLSMLNPANGAATVIDGEKLFLTPEWDIRVGDELLVTGPAGVSNPQTDRFFAGKPRIYASHQEIKLEIRGRA